MCLLLEYMTIGHQYFCSKRYMSAETMTPLYGDAASGLKSTTHPHSLMPPNQCKTIHQSLIHTCHLTDCP